MLVVLVALGGLVRHGEMVASANMPGHHLSASSADKIVVDGQHPGIGHQAPETGMADACAIICLGTPAPWIAVAQVAPVLTEQAPDWFFTDAAHAGRGVGPGIRPPISI